MAKYGYEKGHKNTKTKTIYIFHLTRKLFTVCDNKDLASQVTGVNADTIYYLAKSEKPGEKYIFSFNPKLKDKFEPFV